MRELTRKAGIIAYYCQKNGASIDTPPESILADILGIGQDTDTSDDENIGFKPKPRGKKAMTSMSEPTPVNNMWPLNMPMPFFFPPPTSIQGGLATPYRQAFGIPPAQGPPSPTRQTIPLAGSSTRKPTGPRLEDWFAELDADSDANETSSILLMSYIEQFQKADVNTVADLCRFKPEQLVTYFELPIGTAMKVHELAVELMNGIKK